MVKIGLQSASRSSYSPIKNVVASQLVRCRLRRSTKLCSFISPASIDLRTTARNESTNTSLGLVASTSLMIAPSTDSRP